MTIANKIYQSIRSVWIYTITLIYCCFLRLNKKRRIFVMNIPEHGNMGDEAIVLAEKKLFSYFFAQIPCTMISDRQWSLAKKWIIRSVKTSDLICLHGGGYIGDIWRGVEANARDMIDSFPNNQKVMMPNTVFYYADCAKDDLKFYMDKKIAFFLRDQMSYDIVKKCGLKNAYLFPDSVPFMEETSSNLKRSEEVLLCMRNDKEKTIKEQDTRFIIKALKDVGLGYKVSDTMTKHGVRKWNIRYKVQRKLDEFRKAKFVITDRLHGMYFCAITGTPCIALNNVSKKVGEGTRWLKHLPYILCIDEYNEKEIVQSIKDIIKMCEEKFVYSNIELMHYYEEEMNIIRMWWRK